MFVACAEKKDLNYSQNSEAQILEIISNRPQNWTQFLAIVKLKEPALFSTAQVIDGKTVVDEELKSRILAEQEVVIKKLMELSSEIKILHQYRLVLNGLAIVAPKNLASSLAKLYEFSYIEGDAPIARPTVAFDNTKETPASIAQSNSTTFIGADKIQKELGFTGKGIKVGIIDTGIDFTHAMFGGEGTVEAFKKIDPANSTHFIPNAKVVGGIDLVGTKYNSNSGLFELHIPLIDNNPIDEGGHGTHVAGTVAGKGDGINTYDGVAPEAELYAIKVFGKDGSTGDAAVVAALEYAADPNQDLDFSDRLDVLNMSLGSNFGKPRILYQEAIKNSTKGGTITVASAGNSGNVDFITGAPATVAEAISVAASVDQMDQNWKFNAVKFESSQTGIALISEAIESTMTKTIKDAGDLSGKLVFIGLAAQDLTEEEKALLKGHVALIDRGAVTFSSKIGKAHAAGAIGVVVVNNSDSEPIRMGGDGEYDIPAVMITKSLGAQIKKLMSTEDVVIKFQTPEKIEKPQLIDTLTGFSSKGPRSEDALLKPEISAPGNNIISADMGKGEKGVQLSGTSMAAPHMAGVMALLKHARPTLTPHELKSIVMNSAKTIADEKGERYLFSYQGAGRVQAYQSALAPIVTSEVAISLGLQKVSLKKVIRRNLVIKNISAAALKLQVRAELSAGLSVAVENQVEIAAGTEKELKLTFTIKPENEKYEIDGLIKLMNNETEVARVPVLVAIDRIGQVKVDSLQILANSAADAQGASVDLLLTNSGSHQGDVQLFNLLGRDARKQKASHVASTRSQNCDLEAAGYRIVGQTEERKLQIGVKLFEAQTSFQGCQISVLIDSDQDQIADQELMGMAQADVPGLSLQTLSSLLFDAKKVRELRAKYEADLKTAEDLSKVEENLSDAVLNTSPMITYQHSTLAVLEVPVSALALNANGLLKVKLSVLHEDKGAVEADDYLGSDQEKWLKINLAEESQSFRSLPEKLSVASGATVKVELEKGESNESLMALFPQNAWSSSLIGNDDQMQLPKASYLK
jgi:subtilisin family serine protease